MNKKIFFFLLIPSLGFSQVQIGQDINAIQQTELLGKRVAMSGDGTTIVTSASGYKTINNNRGAVRVFKNANGSWVQVGSSIESNGIADHLGSDVDITHNGNIIAVASSGNPGDDSTGYVSVYEYDGIGNWIQIGNNIYGKNSKENFGYSITLSAEGNTIAVSAPYNTDDMLKGRVMVYRFLNGDWAQIGSDISYADNNSSYFGWDISLSDDGNILAVGSLDNCFGCTGIAKVHVYENISSNWTKLGNEIIGSAPFETSAGVSLSSDGKTLAVGAPHNSSNGTYSGEVRVYKYLSGSWYKIGSSINGLQDAIRSGQSLSLSANGSVLAVGSPASSNISGSVQIYEYINGFWYKKGADINSKIVGDYTGESVSLSADGTKIVIGSPNYSSAGYGFAGLVRVFDLTSILAINNFISDNFKVYPNPATDLLNITNSENISVNQAEIYDLNGRIISTQNFSSTTYLQLNIADLARGTYMLYLKTNQGKAVKKIIKE